MSPALVERVAVATDTFEDHISLTPVVSADFDMTLYQQPLWSAIKGLSLYETTVPMAPTFTCDNCSIDNNTVTVTWLPDTRGVCDGFTLEMDDGTGYTVLHRPAYTNSICISVLDDRLSTK